MNDNQFKVFWFAEDQQYVAICDQYPSLSYMDDDEAKALEGIKKLVAEVELDISEEENVSLDQESY